MKLLLIILSLVTASCSHVSFEDMVKSRAAYDFNCPKDKVKVSKISIGSYGARGCKKKSAYVCAGSSTAVVCKRN